MDEPSIVLLEGDDDYRSKLSKYLLENGFKITPAETLRDLYGHIHNHEWKIFLINFGANTSRGLEFLKACARQQRGPVLVLSDSDDQIDRIVSLELGADDCIAKSTHLREILARIRVAARRKPSGPLPPAPAQLPEAPVEPAVTEDTSSGWGFSREQHKLIAPDGKAVDLTADQFSLLDVLIQNHGQPLSRDSLSRSVFGRPYKAGDRSIDNLVVRLRRRLGEPARLPRIIKTARSGGYFFGGFPDQAAARPLLARQDKQRAA
jgi:DNA-binding response OmpR family regulator